MADYTVFASPEFDPNEYANAILAGESYPATGEAKQNTKSLAHLRGSTQESATKEDISVSISKLTFGIEDVSKQIRNLVTAHHDDLLTQASNANALSGALTSVRTGLTDLDMSVEKLRVKVHVPYENLRTLNLRLQKAHTASDILRRISRFVTLARRLQSQVNEIRGIKGFDKPNPDELATATVVHGKDIEDDKERAIAKAALSIAELGNLMNEESQEGGQSDDKHTEVSLRSVKLVAAYEPLIDEAKTLVTNEMENMVLTGLTTLNQTLLASSLQTAYNLGVLPTLTASLILDLSQAVEDRIRSTFDLNKISRDAALREPVVNTPQSPHYRSRVRTEPTNLTAPQWSNALWARLETMFQEMADCCIKVYALEKVLKIKKDPITHVIFLDEAMKVLENKPSAMFWMTLSRSLQKAFQDSAKGSTFLQQTLSTGYPRLLRLFHDFFGKITLHTDTTYSDTFQSPETILVLRSTSTLETQYLSRSANKINEGVGQASLASNRIPGTTEGINLARAIVNELDAARFDPLLVRSVARNASSCLENILAKVDGLIARDRSAITLSGLTATPQQVSNASLVNFLYQTWSRLSGLSEQHGQAVVNGMRPSIQKSREVFDGIMDPMTMAVRRELNAIVAKLHRVDFSKNVDPNAGLGPSFYMKELTEKTTFIKSEIVNRYNLGDWGKTWTTSLAKGVIRTFILHVSIASPLGESGKLQMATDMTALEFALNAFISDAQTKRGESLESIGEEYRTLRAMRPLFFLENKDLASKTHTAGLPPLIVLHHILVRSTIPLPHQLHGWQEAEYVRWVEEHSEEESWTLVEGGLAHWEKITESEGKDVTDALEYVELARKVLKEVQRR